MSAALPRQERERGPRAFPATALAALGRRSRTDPGVRIWLKHAVVGLALLVVYVQTSRIAWTNVVRHEQTLATTTRVIEDSRAHHTPVKVATLVRLIRQDRADDAAAKHILIGWFSAFFILLIYEATQIARLRYAGTRNEMQRVVAERALIEQREKDLRLRNRELERLAGTDALTGLSNRRAIVAWMRREVPSLAHEGHPLGVLMIDIDHFKGLNDTHGHAIGDEALRVVARTIQERVRASDLAARYGGEEFIVLLPGAGPIDTAEVAEVIREGIAMAPWGAGDLRVSVGAVSGVPEFDGDALIRAADRALYDAKRSGRNRTVVGQTTPRIGAVAARRN